MPACLDHLLICCSAGAPEAARLIEAGLTEGSPNRHPGQGTANRRFFFRNAYLELLWVESVAEAQSEPASHLRLFDRWAGRVSGTCPFGAGFRPGAGPPSAAGPSAAAGPPFASWAYTPSYLPPGTAIDVAFSTSLNEPELFFLAFAQRPDTYTGGRREPVMHAIEVQEITRATIHLPESARLSAAAERVQAAGLLDYRRGPRHLLEIEFDGGRREAGADLQPDLPLLLRW